MVLWHFCPTGSDRKACACVSLVFGINVKDLNEDCALNLNVHVLS